MGERAAPNAFAIPGPISAGGGCRLWRARDGWIALNLARADDRDLLPALFGEAGFATGDDTAIAAAMARANCAALLAQGRALGLAIAAMAETPACPPSEVLTIGPDRLPEHDRRPKGEARPCWICRRYGPDRSPAICCG